MDHWMDLEQKLIAKSIFVLNLLICYHFLPDKDEFFYCLKLV